MDRRRYLVAYDIRDETRLRAVHVIVRDHGDMLQYSVYLCDLDRGELALLRNLLTDAIDRTVDSVLVLDLGETARTGASRFRFLGVAPRLPERGATVV